jgi:multiple sugar transport system substrate-binding protein
LKKICVLFLVFCMLLLTFSASATEPVTLKLTYWGSPIEKEAVIKSIEKFMEVNPGIKVDAQHIPDNYETKITTMIAGNIAPDVAYLGESFALSLAEEGKLYNIQEFLDVDQELKREDFLPNIWYDYGEGKTLGTNTACETFALYYNKDMFDAVGLAYPPTTPDTAWSWDEFLNVCKTLTIDNNGVNAHDPNFDPNNIKQYAIQFDTWWAGYLWAVQSNGGDYANEEGTELVLNSPEATEAIQLLADLMNVHHVAPSPIQRQALPSPTISLQSQQIAMAITGQWVLLDLGVAAADGDLNFGVGILPKLKKSTTVVLGAPTVIFASTEHPQESWLLFKWMANPESSLDLHAGGLWMPLLTEWYENEELLAKWAVNNPAHPDGYVDAAAKQTLENGIAGPSYTLRNFSKIDSIVAAALDRVWLGEVSAQEAMDEASETAQPEMSGRYGK